jgi:hypothetical protein
MPPPIVPTLLDLSRAALWILTAATFICLAVVAS